MQLQVTAADQQRQALAAISQARRGHPELSSIALALQGKKVDFGKVLKMIDEMVGTLKAKQQSDDHLFHRRPQNFFSRRSSGHVRVCPNWFMLWSLFVILHCYTCDGVCWGKSWK